MTEKVLEKRICRACGADVRPGALFCYACGTSVAPVISVAANESRAVDTSAGEKNSDAASRNGEGGGADTLEVAAIRKPDESLPDEFHSKPNIELKPAAPRRENRNARKKAVKVVWEEAEGAPNVLFLIVSLVLTAFAVLALMAMLSLE